MKRAEKAERIQALLDDLYPEPPVPLEHESPFQLLIAVLLSAQTTDVRVNLVTPGLFARGPDARAMAKLSVAEILGHIKTCGLAPTKARNVRALAQLLERDHGGQVPRSLAELERLPGVGHKTASVVVSQAFGEPAFPVDTHIHRLAARWGLSDGSNVVRTERDLKRVFPRERWNDLHLSIIWFGRDHCPALRHDFDACPICSWAASKAYRAREARARRAPRSAKAPSSPGSPGSPGQQRAGA